MHRCRWAGCNRSIPETLYMCAPHWFRLPSHLRAELWNGYRRGVLSPQYIAAHQEIQTWLKDHNLEERSPITE